MTFEQQKDILDHTFQLLTEFNHGISPKGSVAPWWETSKEGTELLLDKGIEYGTTYLPWYSVSGLTDFTRSFGHVSRVKWFDTFIGTLLDSPKLAGVLSTRSAYVAQDRL